MKKQDFVEYQEQNGITLSELASRIGISHKTLWMFLNTPTKRKRSVMFKLKKFYDDNIAPVQQLDIFEPAEKDDKVEETEEEINKVADEVIESLISSRKVSDFGFSFVALYTALYTLRTQDVIAEGTYDYLCELLNNIGEAHSRD